MSAAGAAPRLALRAVAKRFGETRALGDVALEVAPGEVHAVLGENGAGKSTLMRILAGALASDAGTMALDGRPYAPRTPHDARAAGVVLIHQELALAPHLSVAENVCLGNEPRRGVLLDRPALHARARAALAQVGRAELDPARRVGELPLADRQLVEIARALALETRLLILDEPTSSLARADVAHLFTRIRALAARGVSVLYISHVLEEVFALATRFTVLRDGVSVASGELASETQASLVRRMAGREVGELYPRSPSVPGEVVLRLERLAGARLPLDASLELRRGEVLGIAGLIGAGRTELLRALFGLAPVRTGALRMLALEGPRQPRARWHSGVGFLSEDRKGEGLALARSVAENLALPMLARVARRGVLNPGELARRAAPWIERLGVRCASARQAVGALSGGNQQKVALARLLAAEVDLLLLDEPTRGVDVGAKAEIYRWIDTLARREGKAVLLVSSYLPELLGVADRIAVMTRGVLGAARPVTQWDEHALLLAATGASA
ncbi:MAG: sugar ABC transporter ATP-binding protein [Planctomycetes bacterium]|nr:sugar ABC transporter ATP-binding protein [Planctomycetota bacterium]